MNYTNYSNTISHRVTAWAKLVACLMSAGLAMDLSAKDTHFSGTGNWSDPSKWNNGVPQAGDKAIIYDGAKVTMGGTIGTGYIVGMNNVSIVATNANVSLSEGMYLGTDVNRKASMGVTNSSITAKSSQIGSNSGTAVTYLQKGGSFTSTYLLDVYGTGPSRMAFDGVDATFKTFRLVVGRGTGADVSFSNRTFTIDNSDILMGISSAATGRLSFENETLNLGANTRKRWYVGYSNNNAAEPSLVTMKDCVVNQNQDLQVNVAIGVGTAAKGLLVATDCAWTNSSGASVFVGGGSSDSGASGQVILSNCTFKTAVATENGYSFVLGQLRGTKGRLDIVGGTFDSNTPGEIDTSKVMVGLNSGSAGVLAIHGRTLTALPTYQYTEGSDNTLELVNCNYSKDQAQIIGIKNGAKRLHVIGGSFNVGSDKNLIAGSNAATDGGSGMGELLFDDADITCGLLVSGRNSNHPGSIVLRNGAVVNAANVYAGFAGNAVGTITNIGATIKASDNIYIGNAAGSRTYYMDGEGSKTTAKIFRVPSLGICDAVIGGEIDVNNFNIGAAGTYTGNVQVVQGAFIDATEQFYVGATKYPGIATLELKGGTIQAPFVRRYDPDGGAYGTSYIYFNGGTLKARSDQASNWIAPDFTTTAVSDGGAVFDSNGHTVVSAASLTHDSRSAAAAKDGGIVKKGTGTVKLTGSLSFNGDIRVEAGTLDLSRATYSMGSSAGLSGSGTLMAPAGGLSCGGKVLLDASRGTLTVDGALTLGGTATVEVENPETLDRSRSYTLLSATSLAGTPVVEGLGNGWNVSNTGTALRLSYSSPTTIIMR